MMEIEYVCIGNNGRSPIAEAVGKHYVAEKGLEVIISSSGTIHHPMFEQLRTPEAKACLIRVGLQQNLFIGDLEEIARAIAAGNYDGIDECWNYFVQSEGAFRDAALQEIGLAVQDVHKPTTPRDVDVILGMTQENADAVSDIYAGSSFKPIITTLNTYAGMPGEVPNAAGRQREAYREIVAHMLKAVPRTIDRALEELR